MQTTRSVLIKTLAPVLAGMLATKLASSLSRREAAAEPPPSDALQSGAPESLIEVREIEQVIDEATKEPALADAFARKHWTRSRGVLAGLAIALLSGGGFLTDAIRAEDVADIVQHLDKIIVGVLGLLAAWGRIKARKAIS